MRLAGMVLVAVACFAGGAAARTEGEALADCQGEQSGRKAPYTAACGGKSECLPTDVLDIKPVLPTTVPLKAVCLKLGTAGAVWQALDTYDTDKPPQPPLQYALAPLMARWLREPAKQDALRRAQGPLLVDVTLVDRDNVRYRLPLQIETATLWSGGSLPLRIASAQCASAACPFDGTVRLQIPELRTWMRATNADLKKLHLLVDGVPLPGLTPVVAGLDTQPELRFQLQRHADKPDSVLAWNGLLKRALGHNPPVTLGIADEKGVIAETQGSAFQVDPRGTRVGVILFAGLVLAVAVAFLGRKVHWKWIRDSYGLPDQVVPDEKRSFSLGRSQMLWWTCIIALAWFAIGRATGDWASLNESSLILLGISVGTAVGAMATAPDRVNALVASYTNAKAALEANPQDAKAQADLVTAKAAIVGDANVRSGGFLRDITSDYGQGTGLHRLQNILFTLAFGAWFLWVAFSEGAMPTLSATMLTLMGISGSAYVGFKLVGK
jgi:hypothetical protein